MGAMANLLNWWNGWRLDLDGWLVRARRARDPDLSAMNRSDIGFVDEACIAVRTPRHARMIDRGLVRPHPGGIQVMMRDVEKVAAAIARVRHADSEHVSEHDRELAEAALAALAPQVVDREGVKSAIRGPLGKHAFGPRFETIVSEIADAIIAMLGNGLSQSKPSADAQERSHEAQHSDGVEEVIAYRSRDGELHAYRDFAARCNRQLDEIDAANAILEAGGTVGDAVRAYGYTSTDPVLDRITKDTPLIIRHWQCRDEPGYKVCRFEREGIWVFGNAGSWSGHYGSYVPVRDLVRYAEHTLSLHPEAAREAPRVAALSEGEAEAPGGTP